MGGTSTPVAGAIRRPTCHVWNMVGQGMVYWRTFPSDFKIHKHVARVKQRDTDTAMIQSIPVSMYTMRQRSQHTSTKVSKSTCRPCWQRIALKRQEIWISTCTSQAAPTSTDPDNAESLCWCSVAAVESHRLV